VGEDLVNPLNIAIQKKRVIFDERIVVEEDANASFKSELKMRTRVSNRNVAGLFKYWRYLNFKYGFVAYQLFLHKYCRVFSWLPLILLFVMNLLLANRTPYIYFLLLQVCFYAMATLGYFLENARKSSKLLFIPYYFALINLGCCLGFIQYCLGERKATWVPER
jgi:hypothetical protein